MRARPRPRWPVHDTDRTGLLDCRDVAVTRPRAAVVGSGVAGLTAAYILQRRYDVTLFEADRRLGGHAHTHEVSATGGRTVRVDTGFLVHNDRTYPQLLRRCSPRNPRCR
jgi:predicted NAD/FAD-binding protein